MRLMQVKQIGRLREEYGLREKDDGHGWIYRRDVATTGPITV